MGKSVLKRIASSVSMVAIISMIATSTCGTLVNAQSVSDNVTNLKSSYTQSYNIKNLGKNEHYQKELENKSFDKFVKTAKPLQSVAPKASAKASPDLQTRAVAVSATTNASADGISNPNGLYSIADTLTTSSSAKAYTFSIANDQAAAFELQTSDSDYYMYILSIDPTTGQIISVVALIDGQYLNSLMEDDKLTAGTYELYVSSTNTVGSAFSVGVNVTNPGDNTKSFAAADINYVGLVCNNGDIYSNGAAVYTGGDTSNLNWNETYSGAGGSTSRTQLIDEVKVNTIEPVVAASYNTSAYEGVQTYNSPEVLLIPLNVETDYMYHYVSYINNNLISTFVDATGQATPRLLNDTDIADEGVRVTVGTNTITLPVSLAYDMRTNTVFDFYSCLNYYYALDPSRVSVTILS